MKKAVIIIPVFAFLALGIIWAVLDASSPTGFSIKQLNPFLDCVDVEVEHQETEIVEVDIKYSIIDNYMDTFLKDGSDQWAVAVLKVLNDDSVPGQFTVTRFFETEADGKSSSIKTQTILPGETVEFRDEYDIDNGEEFLASYLIVPSTKKAPRLITKTRLEKKCE